MAKVRLIAVNPKYRTMPFYCVAVYDENKRAFKTGQEHLTPEQLKAEPIQIDPDVQYPVRHMEEFDTNNRKDALMFALMKTQDKIAPKASSVVPGMHLFYLQDFEQEAGENVTRMDLMFEALSKVKANTSISRQSDIAIFLGISIDQPMSVIQDRLYRICENNPESVLEFFNDRNSNRLFAMKLKYYGIVQFRDGKYSDNEIFIGRSIEDLILFIQERKNESIVAKWGMKLDKIEGIAPKSSGQFKSTEETFKAPITQKEAFRSAVEDDKKSEADAEKADRSQADASISSISGAASNGENLSQAEKINVVEGQPQEAKPAAAKAPVRGKPFQKKDSTSKK